jgi:D-alanine transaminase
MGAGGLVYLNGAFLERAHALVPVDDRGFVFGDGVYEVIRAIDGRLFERERHVERLGRSVTAIRIAIPDAEVDRLGDVWHELLRRNELKTGEATVYTQITRGVAPRAHAFPPAGTAPTIFASASRLALPTAVRARGARGITVPDLRWARCNIKTVTLLPNVLARQQAVEAGADEAFFVRDGIVLEGAASNLFAVIDGEIWTHPLTTYILPGITRDVVIELAHAAHMVVRERPILLEDLARATELFFTGTANDVMPIVSMDGRPIGAGQPGPVAGQLYVALLTRMGGRPAA